MLALALGACGNPPSGDAPADATYPTRPVTIVVTFPPGGGTGLLAWRLGASLHEQMLQSGRVVNRPGATCHLRPRLLHEPAPVRFRLSPR
ncbi:tripartite tricarboxylate transporter substrate binding protein, partial [Achromobacter ruhlandii]|nr:tripartite tricarboxylate transporter substrate binding protein [Achromobacter ruhlandii]